MVFFREKNLEFFENRWFREKSQKMHIELYYWLSVLKKRSKMFCFAKNLEWSKKCSQVLRKYKHCKFLLEGLPKVPTALDFSKKNQNLCFFRKRDESFQKTQLKLSETLNFASLLIEMRLDFYYCSWGLETFKILAFLEKEMIFFREILATFQKHST